MDKVKIQEIAAEAGLSNADLLAKAGELGLNVKAANSSISMEEAGILVEYAISGVLPKTFKKPVKKSKITVIKKAKPEDEASRQEAIAKKEETPQVPLEVNEPHKGEESTKIEPISEVEISVQSDEIEPTQPTPPQKVALPEEKHKVSEKAKKLSRGGITIVRKAKPEPVKKIETISMPSVVAAASTKKKKTNKKNVEAKESGEKLEILGNRDFVGSDEIYDEDEVVLLDFSDKNIYEEMKRQEERRKLEQKKRGDQINAFVPQQKRTIRRGGKKRKYIKSEESGEKITVIEIPENVRVYEFAEKVGRNVGEVVKVLFSLGTMVTKNDFLDKDSIEILCDEFEVEVNTINPLDLLDYVGAYDAQPNTTLVERPPVITIMGHVDHGKTSLLDKIRSTKVAAKEAGGITQHVGAYQVEKNGKKITFVDTPGHEAFTLMRARGAQATDIVIIVVAADDGVKPQTREAISHVKASGAPMIVAINKMDKPSANPEMVKAQLADLNVLSVDWGGDVEFIPVSAHTGEGIEDLLDVILIQAEMMELLADPTRPAKAVVVESSVEKGFGPVANVIIQNGTLNIGDNIIIGNTFGRVRTMRLDDGSNRKSIGPGTPAAIMGLSEVPDAGEILVVFDNEKDVRELAQKRAEYSRSQFLSKSTKATLDDLSALIAEGQLKALPVIIKADVHGSLEAIKGSLDKLKNEEVKVNIIHEGVGGVTESDVTLADASENSIILGFNVRPTGIVKKKAKELGVEIKSYSIIYDLIDDVKALLGGMMSPVISEEITGQAEVRETFAVAKVGTIAGCKVSEGSIIRGAKARLIRDGVVIYTSSISSLKRFTEDAREVKNGYECGIMLDKYNDIKAGDTIETFKNVEEQVTL